MKRYNEKVLTDGEETTVGSDELPIMGRGKVKDLILPIVVLVVLCICAMLYTGGILEGADVVTAFANCDSSLSLVLGSFFALVFTFVLYLGRKILTFEAFCESFVQGFRSMTPPIMILCLAWTLSGSLQCGLHEYRRICRESGSGKFAGGYSASVSVLPDRDGTCVLHRNLGTFGILIPIALAILGTGDVSSLSVTVAAILAGAVCGDHISPISDTTILASAGAQCNHINHVSTQIPYALLVAACCFAGYLTAGIAGNGWAGLAVGVICLAVILAVITVNEKNTKSS